MLDNFSEHEFFVSVLRLCNNVFSELFDTFCFLWLAVHDFSVYFCCEEHFFFR